MSLGIGIQLVEVGHPHGEVGIGKQLDCFRLGAIRQQYRHVLLDGAALQQGGEPLSPLGALPHYDARGVQVVMKCPPLSQELW